MIDSGFKRRAFLVCLILVTGLSGLSIKLISLHVWDRQIPDTASIPRFQIRKRIPARRGDITDRNKVVMVQDLSQATLVADKIHLETGDILWSAVILGKAKEFPGWPDLTEEEQAQVLAGTKRELKKTLSEKELIKLHRSYAARVLEPVINLSPGEIDTRLDAAKVRAVVKRGLLEGQVQFLEKELQAHHIQGFSFERSNRRHYSMPELAPHIWGFRNLEGVAQNGLEKSMDEYLSGRDGEKILSQHENGQVNLTGPEKFIPPKMGKDVRTTIDINIQRIVEQELDRICGKMEPLNASIIVVEPRNGDVLAIGSRPHYNLQIRKNYEFASSSFAVSAQYESGSVMKIVPMAAALESGRITRESTVWDDKQWLRDRRVSIKGYFSGDRTFDEVLAKSSNIGVFLFVDKNLGRAGFYNYLRKFGFGTRTGFRIPGEATGVIRDETNMTNYGSATYGYGVSVTPLQLAMAYSALANGGMLMKPRLVDAIIAHNGTVLERTPIRQVRRVIKEETARQMRLALEKVVLNGTGKDAKLDGYRAAGKTGTARKLKKQGKGYDEVNQNRRFFSFAGMVPVQNPQFVCIVTIDEPTKFDDVTKFGGGATAGPSFKTVAEKTAHYLNIPRTEIPVALTSE